MLTLERILTSPKGFGLTTASNAQRAICRVADGLPLGDVATDPAVIAAFGITDPTAPIPRPRELYIVSGSRVGKTLLAAALAFRAAMTVDVTGLGPGDEPRIPILSLDRDKAAACFTHLVGTLNSRPTLKRLVIHEGRNELDSLAVWLRHPSGRAIQICVAAGKRAGNAVVSYFLAGVIFDEFCKMSGSGEAVVNFDDSRQNALGRLLPGAQLVGIGSPWAPYGPAYETVQEHFGKPTDKICVVRGRGRDLNPAWWTAERIASLPPDILRTEEQAEFRDSEESLIPSLDLLACTRAEAGHAKRLGRHTYAAFIDPATRGNSWTLIVATKDIDERVIVAHACQWTGSKVEPLSPDVVFGSIKKICDTYGVTEVTSDQWSSDAMRDIAERHGLSFASRAMSRSDRVTAYERLQTMFADRQIEIPPNPTLRTDLLAVRKRVNTTGFEIVLPKTGDGRHADYAAAMALAASEYIPPATAAPDKRGTKEWAAREEREMDEAMDRETHNTEEWWEQAA